MNTDKCKLDIIKFKSITELIRFKKKGKKVKKNKIKKRVLNEYIKQQINNKKYYHWSSRLIVFIFIGIGNA